MQDVANSAKEELMLATERKMAYEKRYKVFHKLLSASSRTVPLSEIIDCIDKVIVDRAMQIMVEWVIL